MNILFFTRLFYPHIGGVEKHVLTLSKHLIKRGHNITIITESLSETTTKPHEIYENIHVYRMPHWSGGRTKKINTWKWIFSHQELIKNAEVIHIHDVFYWYLPFRILYPQKPVYTTFHGYESYPLPKNAKLQHKIAEQLSWGNICIGDFIPKWYGTKPTYVSYGAVEIPAKITTTKNRNSAIFIGRLDEQTGIKDYSLAIEQVRKEAPQFNFIVIGDGPLRTVLPRSTEFKGFQDNPEKFLNDNHFAFVSRYLSILEAMAHRKLVFALYDNPIKEDYLRLAPFADSIIIANSPIELSEKVKYYLKNHQEEKILVEKNYNWVKNQTWDNLTNLYLNLWLKTTSKI